MSDEPREDGGDHFARFNALVRNGWLRKNALTETELKVLLIYEMHARADGSEARPALKTVQRYLGHARDGHIRMARNNLVRYGLLSRSDDQVGGRSGSAVRMLLPPRDAERVVAAVQSAPVPGAPVRSAPDRGAPVPSAPVPSAPNARALGAPDARALGARNRSAAHKEEQPNEQPNELPAPAAAGAAAASAGAGAAAKGTGTAAPKRKSERERTDEEHRVRAAVIEWFRERWAEWHDGAPYDFFSEDRVKQKINHRSMWGILDELLWNEEHAYLATAYFARWCAESFAQFHVPLKHMRKDPKKWLRAAQQCQSAGRLKIGGDHANGPTPGAAPDAIAIPSGRNLGGARPGAGGAGGAPGINAAG